MLDTVHIQRAKYDQELNADRVAIVDANISVQLDHKDGDSVITKKQTEVISINENTLINVSNINKICFYGELQTCDVIIMHNNQEIHTITLQKGQVIEILAEQIKINPLQPIVLMIQ